MKKTFIHTFSNGDRCTLVLDFTGDKGRADAKWSNPTKENRFSEIESEYCAWRSIVFSEFMEGMTIKQQMEVVSKL